MNDVIQPHIATIENDGRRYNVSLRVVFDGVEYMGRLWFADESWDDLGLPDRGAFPGRTREECIALAERLHAMRTQDPLQRIKKPLKVV